MMGNYGWIFHLLDHKTCPIGGAFDFGYLTELYTPQYTRIFFVHLNQLDRATKEHLEPALILILNSFSVTSLCKIKGIVSCYKG